MTIGAQVTRAWRWSMQRPPYAYLLVGLAVFWIYSWPGFVGWDTRDHLIQARLGTYSDGHPPCVARLYRLVEFFIAGPAGMLILQSVTLLVGLYFVLRCRLASRTAAMIAAAVFLFPPIAGVTAVIAKDSLMAGCLLVGIGCLANRERPRPLLGALFILFATLLRWNAFAATCAPMVLLWQWRPSVRGVKRYAIAFGLWLVLSFGATRANLMLADTEEHIWSWSSAYQDIAGVLEYSEPLDDATLRDALRDTPLLVHENIQARFRAVYNAVNFYHLMRGPGRLFDIASTQAQRDAITVAWKKIVLARPAAYATYRWDNYRALLQLERPPTSTNVYHWFTVIGAPETIAELEHDAAPSRLQSRLVAASVRISLSPLYWVFLYFSACFLMLPFCRGRSLEAGLLLGAIGYELAWLFLSVTTDYRYSQWMIICSVLTIVLLGVSRGRQRLASRRTS